MLADLSAELISPDVRMFAFCRAKVNVSVALKFYKELSSHGADDLLRRVYGNLLLDKPEEGYDVTLQVDLNTVPEDWETSIVAKVGLLKRHCFAAVFERYFEFQVNLTILLPFISLSSLGFKHLLLCWFIICAFLLNLGFKQLLCWFITEQEKEEEGHKAATIHYRDDETMFIEAKSDRVTVVFSTIFKDDDDVVLGKVFLQEFKEGRRASATAPQVTSMK
jgi:actin related protein 2/3 complex subunit 2